MANMPGGSSETIIGSDATFKGEMTFDGAMRIEGKFEGKLTTKGRLTIGKGANMAGEAQVGNATVDGAVKGNIVAGEKVDLTATAQVQGDIRAPRLVVAEGATLVGNVMISPEAVRGSMERDVLLANSNAAPQNVPAKRQ